ncbi:MAG: GtrA family protein [Coxiellaceae bacterium]|nr:MAG: GtrA family protein [Coxiellaceae bacterium]
MSIERIFVSKQFIRFALVGGFAALVNFLSRIALSYILSYVTAIVIAYILGMCTAFLLCRLFVFEPQQHSNVTQASYFILVNVLAVLQTIAISLLLADWLLVGVIIDTSLREAVAHFFGVCFPIFSSFIGHKYLTFR